MAEYPLLLTLSSDSKCGVMFLLGSLIALRDLGLLHRVVLIQGIGWGNIIVGQLFSVLRSLAEEHLLSTPTITTEETCDVNTLRNLQLRVNADAWNHLLTTGDELIHKVWEPLYMIWGMRNQAYMYAWAWLRHRCSIPLALEDVGRTLERTMQRRSGTSDICSLLEYPVDSTHHSSIPMIQPPVLVFSGKHTEIDNRVMGITNDISAPVLSRDTVPYVQCYRPHVHRSLVSIITQTMMYPAISPYEMESSLYSDPFGLAVIHPYYMRLCHPITLPQADQCIILIDGRCASMHQSISEYLLKAYYLCPNDEHHEVPRFYRSQPIIWNEYPNSTKHLNRLLDAMRLSADHDGWVGVDADLLSHATNWGHALTYWRYSINETQRQNYQGLFVTNIGDPYRIIYTLNPSIEVQQKEEKKNKISKKKKIIQFAPPPSVELDEIKTFDMNDHDNDDEQRLLYTVSTPRNHAMAGYKTEISDL